MIIPFGKVWRHFVVSVVLASAMTAPAIADDVRQYIPDDSDWAVLVQVRPLMNSPIVKKHFLPPIQKKLLQQPQARQMLLLAGINPLKDVDNILVAGTTTRAATRVLAVLQGRFHPKRIQAAAQKLASSDPGRCKVQSQGKISWYEILDKKRSISIFLRCVSQEILLVASSRESLLAVSGVGALKPTKHIKELRTLLSQADKTKSFYLAFLMPEWLQAALARQSQLGPVMEKFNSLTGTATIDKDVQIVLNARMSDAEAAAGLRELLEDTKDFAALMAQTLPVYGSLCAELIDACKTATDKNVTTVSGKLTEEQVAKALQSDQKAQKDHGKKKK